MVVIAVLAVICGADGWVQVEQFGRAKFKWLGTFLDLPGGVPSHDTFGRVFAALDPAAFERCFVAWMSALVEVAGGKLVAIDGKALRRSFGHAWDRSGMAHLVSAFVTCGGNRLVFGQLAVDGKSNEITAIPRLLALLDLKGAVVTIDAIGCQREIAGRIVAGGGDYALPVKDNQQGLLRKVKALLDEAVLAGFAGMTHGSYEEAGEGHGRVEARRVWVTDEVRWLGKGLLGKWPGLAGGSLAVVERVRQDLGDPAGKVTTERALLHLQPRGDRRPAVRRRRAGPLGGGEQPALAVGRQFRRGRPPDPQRARGRELQPPMPDRPQPAQARHDRQGRGQDQATQRRLGPRLPPPTHLHLTMRLPWLLSGPAFPAAAFLLNIQASSQRCAPRAAGGEVRPHFCPRNPDTAPRP